MASKPSTLSQISSPKDGKSKMEMPLGDLDALDPSISQSNHAHELGEFAGLADFTHDSKMGNLSLADQALEGLPVSAAAKTQIPLLVDSVSHATSIQQEIKAISSARASSAVSESEIPLLNEVASEFDLAMQNPGSGDSALADAMQHLQDDGVIAFPDNAGNEQSTSEIPLLMDVLSTNVSSPQSQTSSRPAGSQFSLETPVSLHEELEDIIPTASSQPRTRFSTMESDILAALSDRSEIATASRPVSQQDSNSQLSQFEIQLPQELHTQLAKKIDQLVIETTTQLTSALNKELNARMETILGEAVQATMTNFAGALAENLQQEVRRRVKSQMPSILNDILGRTQLK